jgi:hypothetical protein
VRLSDADLDFREHSPDNTRMKSAPGERTCASSETSPFDRTHGRLPV